MHAPPLLEKGYPSLSSAFREVPFLLRRKEDAVLVLMESMPLFPVLALVPKLSIYCFLPLALLLVPDMVPRPLFREGWRL